MTHYKFSRFTHVFEHSKGLLMFNGASGSILLLTPQAFQSIQNVFETGERFSQDELVSPLAKTVVQQLLHGRFIIDVSLDEVEELRTLSKLFDQDKTLSITIAPTMDCNLGCYYCFEEKYASYLEEENACLLTEYLKQRLIKDGSNKLLLRWFGGEPMLNPAIIDKISSELIAFCDREMVEYSATMTSNGTCWPELPQDSRDFANRNRITSVQFTFDGLSNNHNKRRHYVRPGAKRTSFNALCDTIDALLGSLTIRLRVNCDPSNIADLPGLADFFKERGWLYPGSNVFPYAVPVSPTTESCDFLHKFKLDMQTFSKAEQHFVGELTHTLGSKAWTEHLKPKTLRVTCDAVSSHALMMGPDGFIYRCSAEMGDHERHHGHIREALNNLTRPTPFKILPAKAVKANDFNSFDVFSQPKCSTCKYLPQCMSGCPKHHLERYREGVQENIDANYAYWEANLASMVRGYVDSLL